MSTMSFPKPGRRRALPLLAAASFAALLMAGCPSGNAGKSADTGASPAAPGGSGAGGNGKALAVAVIPKGLTHVFWQSVKAGAEKAGSEMNATIRWDGPQKETDTAGQLGVVENAITSRVDGIVLAPLDKAALVPAIKRAKEAGIPLTIFDSAADTEEYVSFVATDNRKGGAMAAERMAKLLNGKGKVAMILVAPNSASTGDREDGFEETMKAKYPGITVIRSNYGNSDRAQSLKVTEDVLTAHDDITGIFGPNESSAVGALQALKNRGLIGKIKLVGFDATKQLEASVTKGEIDSLVLQNPFKMGYEGVKTIVDVKVGRTPERRIDTGVVLMTKDNMDSAEMAALRKTF
uniref:Inositol transport system sugar-binding protein n=1 Tax=uncultured Armatimonadetes bacterium TaxID=157466 RepID=A0A6J4JUS9_9BACT|nr:Inositol transport system sugar-binding protein [uncultured Armatimonadetes bacterium]